MSNIRDLAKENLGFDCLKDGSVYWQKIFGDFPVADDKIVIINQDKHFPLIEIPINVKHEGITLTKCQIGYVYKNIGLAYVRMIGHFKELPGSEIIAQISPTGLQLTGQVVLPEGLEGVSGGLYYIDADTWDNSLEHFSLCSYYSPDKAKTIREFDSIITPYHIKKALEIEPDNTRKSNPINKRGACFAALTTMITSGTLEDFRRKHGKVHESTTNAENAK